MNMQIFKRAGWIVGCILVLAVGDGIAWVVMQYLDEKGLSPTTVSQLATPKSSVTDVERFTSLEDGFSIIFPSEPAISSRDEYAFDGKTLHLKMYFSRTNQDLFHVDVTNATEFGLDVNQFNLQGAVDGMAHGGDGGKIDDQSDVVINGYKGIRYSINANQNYIDGFTFYDGNKIYSVIVDRPLDSSLSLTEINSFLDSFSLTE